MLWFAWKIVPLWYQQQPDEEVVDEDKELWFAWKIVPLWYQQQQYFHNLHRVFGCDLLEKSYLCGINNNSTFRMVLFVLVVICLKNRTFVVSTTTKPREAPYFSMLWFAWKIVPLWYQQQPLSPTHLSDFRCDLLEKSYLCGINNNKYLSYHAL